MTDTGGTSAFTGSTSSSTMYFPTKDDKVSASKALEKEMEQAILDIISSDTYEKLVIAHAKFNANREVATKMGYNRQSFRTSIILEESKQ